MFLLIFIFTCQFNDITLKLDEVEKGTKDQIALLLGIDKNISDSIQLQSSFRVHNSLNNFSSVKVKNNIICYYLTIDRLIQYFVKCELLLLHKLYNPKWSAGIVLSCSSGEILAATSYPDIDYSNRIETGPEFSINRAFSTLYTPGSTFKPLMMALAMHKGVLHEDEIIDCENGRWKINGRAISDVHRDYRLLDLENILLKSSNIGIAKILLRLVPKDTPKGDSSFLNIIDTLYNLGFGKRPGIFAPVQESTGRITSPEYWTRAYTLVSVAFGNEIAVTPIQLAAAFNTLANKGIYTQPILIRSIVRPDGTKVNPIDIKRYRVFSKDALIKISKILKNVISEGFGKKTRIAGLDIAGFSSSSEKLPKREKVAVSFVAYAPENEPKLLIMLLVDEPQGINYGSEIAPHIKNIFTKSLTHLGYPVPRK